MQPAFSPGSLSRLENVLQEIVSSSGCRVGLCAEGLEGPPAGVGFGFREDEAFPSASLIKVLVLAELLRQADSGRLSLEDEILVENDDLIHGSGMLEAERLPARFSCRDLAGAMIRISDNAATNLLIRRVGMEHVNTLARDLGLRRTALRRGMMDFGARLRGEENNHLRFRHGGAHERDLGRIGSHGRIERVRLRTLAGPAPHLEDDRSDPNRRPLRPQDGGARRRGE